MKYRDFTSGKETQLDDTKPMYVANVMAELIDAEGDAFRCKLYFVKDDMKSKSVEFYFEDINELKGLANYLIGLAEELKL